MLSSCDFVTSDNGDLDGLWQATIKEDLQSGDVVDMRDYNSSWSFQGGMVQMNASVLPPDEVVGIFTKTDNYLKVDSLCVFTHVNGDKRIVDVTVLDVFGFTRLDETFQILELNSDALCLQNSRVRLRFRKY